MHKEMQIKKHSKGLFRVVCRDDLGPYEGRAIGERLGLSAVAPPDGGPDINGLQSGQFYMWHPMSRHPELHALVSADRLEDLAQVARDLHMRVSEGAELLPELPPAPQEHAVQHRSSVDAIEERHRSVFQRGPRAAASAFLLRALPGTIGLVILLVLSRHVGDHHQIVGPSTAFTRAASPPPAESFFQSIVNPDHSMEIRLEIRGVRFLDRNRMIFMDGNFVKVAGVADLRPLFDLAHTQAVAPILDARIEDGRIMIERIAAGHEVFATGGELVRVARLEMTAEEPRRGAHSAPGVFREIDELPYDDADAIRPLIGQRIALVGQLVEEDGRRILRLEDGGGIVFRRTRYAKSLDRLHAALIGDPVKVQVDMVLAEMYPWQDRKDPSRSRELTRLIGEAEVYSTSAQDYHVVGRR